MIDIIDVASNYSVFILIADLEKPIFQAYLVFTIFSHLLAPMMSLCSSQHMWHYFKVKPDVMLERYKVFYSIVAEIPMTVITIIVAIQESGENNTSLSLVTSIISLILLSQEYMKLLQHSESLYVSQASATVSV